VAVQVDIVGVEGELKDLAKKTLTIKPNFAYTQAEVGRLTMTGPARSGSVGSAWQLAWLPWAHLGTGPFGGWPRQVALRCPGLP